MSGQGFQRNLSQNESKYHILAEIPKRKGQLYTEKKNTMMT